MTTPPIRILRIIARLNIGGPAIHVSLLTNAFGPPDFESTLVCGHLEAEEGDMAYFAENLGVQPAIVPGLARAINPLTDIRVVWHLYQLMRQLQPDVVHTHTAKAGFAGRIAAKLAGVPVIVHTYHGHVFRGYFNPLVTRIFIAFEQITGRFSDTLITLTEGLRRELSDEFHVAPRRKITVLPLGFDFTPFTSAIRKGGAFRRQWGIASDAPLVSLVGRMVPVKNHALFLEAAVKIRAALPDAHFVLVGDGELRAEIEAQIDALGLRDAVIITGWQRDTATIYADLDALVISSLNEGTSVTVIEALASGCPVVSTAVGGMPDLLDGGELGKLVPSGDADALASAILDTLRNPPDVTRAQHLMIERYSIDRLVSDLDSLYRALLAKKRRRG